MTPLGKGDVKLPVTMFYYMASSREIPTGSYGQKKQVMTLQEYVTNVNPAAKDHPPMQILLEKYPNGDKLMEIYETEEDAAGLYITGPLSNQDSTHVFRQPFVYQVDPEGGSFQLNDEMKHAHPTLYRNSKKCLNGLFDYLRRNLETGEEIELYSCWAHGRDRFVETPIIELSLEIDLSAFRLENAFNWEERQYIRVFRST